jgi:hypothetical protein
MMRGMSNGVRIAWDNLTAGEWSRILQGAGRSTLTQTFAYARAILLTERETAVVGLVEIDDRPVGVVMGLRKKAFAVAETVSIQRGPILLPEAREPAVLLEVLAAIRKRFPPGITKWTHFIPELEATERNAALLAAARFKRTDGPGYRTIWIDLDRPTDELRRGLRLKWRNRLVLAERAEAEGRLTIAVDPVARNLPELVKRYVADKEARKYRGPSGPLVVRLRNALAPEKGAVLVTASVDDRLVAGILVLCHGVAATYQIGWTGPEGRATSATHLLLWRAMEHLAATGRRWFDLGGIQPDTAPGVTLFKRGVGGEEIELAGTWV